MEQSGQQQRLYCKEEQIDYEKKTLTHCGKRDTWQHCRGTWNGSR